MLLNVVPVLRSIAQSAVRFLIFYIYIFDLIFYLHRLTLDLFILHWQQLSISLFLLVDLCVHLSI